MMLRPILLATMAMLGLTACGLQPFTEPASNPVIEEEIGSVQVIATTAPRRLAYIRKQAVQVSKPTPTDLATAKTVAGSSAQTTQAGTAQAAEVDRTAEPHPSIIHLGRFGGGAGEFCAEPSPDAIEAVAAAFGAAIEASNQAQAGVNQELAARFAREVATSTASMFRRSQGVQLYRDGAFFLCQAMMNGYIDAYEYRQALKYLRYDAVFLIEKELATDYWKSGGTLPSVQAPRLPDAPEEEGGGNEGG